MVAKENFERVSLDLHAVAFNITEYGLDINTIADEIRPYDAANAKVLDLDIAIIKKNINDTSDNNLNQFISACNDFIVHNFPVGTNSVTNLEDVSNFIAYITAQLNNANKAFAVQTPAAFVSADKVAQAIAVRNKFLEQRVAELEAENSSLKAQLANK